MVYKFNTQKGVPGYRAGATTQPRSIWASEKNIQYGRGVLDATYCIDGSQGTGKTSILRPGVPMGRITASGLWAPCKRTKVNQAVAADTTIVVDNASLFQSGDTVTIRGKQLVGAVKDNDSAASAGLAVYLHVDELQSNGMAIGHLESVTAGDGDSHVTIGSGGPRLNIQDDDAAATAGLQVYFDEDAAGDSRFLVDNDTHEQDVFVALSDGRFIRFVNDDSASTNGVALYFDDDAAAVDERLMFVSPTNAEGYILSDDSIGQANEAATVNRATTLAITAIDYDTDTITVASTIVNDGDEVFVDVTAQIGLEICRGILNEFVQMEDEDDVARDRQVGKIGLHGLVNNDMCLGDIDAILEQTDGSGRFLSGLTFTDDVGQSAESVST